MSPFTIALPWADICTPSRVIPGCIITTFESGDQVIAVKTSEGLFNLIQDITQRISSTIERYRNAHTIPRDDATSDIGAALEVLHLLSRHLDE